jgi:hypothetical protein
MKKPLLHIKEQGKDNYYVYNHEDVFLGNITRARVGRFMHWIFSPMEQTFYTNGCLKEIIEFITELYKKDRKTN